MSLISEAGFEVLHNRWTEIKPGLILAGIDDLTADYRAGRENDFISRAVTGRPPGVTILLSHTPWQTEKAAAAGVDLMLSAHTHGGQIWPLDYLIRLSYPLLEGQYEVDGMQIIVCRGTGTWGPRMRLWRSGVHNFNNLWPFIDIRHSGCYLLKDLIAEFTFFAFGLLDGIQLYVKRILLRPNGECFFPVDTVSRESSHIQGKYFVNSGFFC